MLIHIIDWFRVRDVCSQSFVVDLIETNQSWICVFDSDNDIWLIYSKLKDIVEFIGYSRIDCLECLYFYYGLPF